MAAHYNSFPSHIPNDGTTVCFRTTLNECYPFKAVYVEVSSSFVAVNSGIIYPSYTCHSWRAI